MSARLEIVRKEKTIEELRIWRESKQETNMYSLKPGNTCLVIPIDPLRKKYHGEHCKILAFREDESAEYGVMVQVSFLEEDKRDEIEPTNLIPVSAK